MRKSIFDIASASINISNEVDRIVSMSAKEKSTYSPPYDLTLFEFVDKCCFRDWSYRGHFVNVVDFLETVNYNEIKKDAKNGDTDAFMTLIELTYNFWNLAYRDIMDKDSQNVRTQASRLPAQSRSQKHELQSFYHYQSHRTLSQA